MNARLGRKVGPLGIMQDIKIWSNYQIVYPQTRNRIRELAA